MSKMQQTMSEIGDDPGHRRIFEPPDYSLLSVETIMSTSVGLFVNQ